jgi:shikimate kinase
MEDMEKREVKNLVLIGMPGCGKSTFGKMLARKLNRPFYDADDVLEERERRTIKDLFAEGEDVFREAEIRTSRYLASGNGQVIACGGGVVERRENLGLYRQTGVILFIDRSPEDIMKDVDTEGRPLLKSGRERILELYDLRIDKYRAAADYCIENKGSEEQVLKRLLELVREEQL